MGSSKETPQITTQSSEPWGPAQPYLKDVIRNANELFNDNVGYKPYTGDVLSPLNKVSKEALSQTLWNARRPVPGLAQAQKFATNMIARNGMTNDLQQVAQDIRGGMGEVSGYLTPFANGSMQEDPRLAAMLDTNANRAANAAATRFGGGRYGSNAIGQGVGTAVTDANNATMLQSNENARNRQLQAAQALGSLNLQGSGLLGNLYENGLARATQATSMLPTLNELRYDGASRIAGVGDFYQNRTQAERDADIAAYEAKQARPWEQLGRLNGIITGMGQLGGTQTGIKPQQRGSTAQRAIGGAMSGAALGSSIGPWGTALGGIGGGLLGLFG